MNQIILNQTSSVLPINGTNEVHLLTIGGTPTAGNLQFSFNNRVSGTAVWSATNATLLAHINTALAGIFGAGSVTAAANSLVSGIGTINLTFGGTYACTPQRALIVAINNLTGTAPTAAITLATQGVLATFRQAASGAKLLFTGNNSLNEFQTLTIGGTPTGTFTITGGTAQNPTQLLTTAAITWSATNGTLLTNIQSALDTTFGSGNTLAALGTITSGVGTITIEFIGTNSCAVMPLFTATGLTTGTTSITRTTAGGTVSTRNAASIPYVNASQTAFQPVWALAGAPILINLGSPVLGTTLTLHTAADTGSDQTFTTFTNQPDVPRCLVSTPSGTTGNVTAVLDYVEGLDANGNFISENLPAYTAGQATAVTSVNAFASVTKYIQRANGASVTITTKYSTKIGLGYPLSDDTVITGFLNGVREATRPTGVPGGNTLAKNLVSLSSALNGSPVLVQASLS